MNAFVWVDSWQHQCCGQDFAVGSHVTWSAVPKEPRDEWVGLLLGEEWAERVGYHQEQHDDGVASVVIAGAVRSIREVRCRRMPQSQGSAQVMVPVAGSGLLTEVTMADKWSPEPSDHPQGQVSFDGWIVELELELSQQRDPNE